jgi:hypothetical protein
VSCYEAGYDGFWLHPFLETHAILNRVLDSASIQVNRRARRVKTDRRYGRCYKVSFPFFDPNFLAAPGNDLPLWRRLVRPGDANLFFVGLFQAIGALMPIVEAQARFIGDCLVGTYGFPPAPQMAEMERARERLSRRFVRSERHTMEVDSDRYLRELERERRRGRVRAHSLALRLQSDAGPALEPTTTPPP